MADRLGPRIGAWVSVLAVLYLVIPHILFWSTGTLADGNHVAQDFHATGMSLSAMERAMGMVIAGLPVLFLSLSLFHLIRFFQGLDGTSRLHGGSSRALVRSSRHALGGAVLLFLYPTLLSLAFFLTQPVEHRTVIVSMQPEVETLLLGGLLFFLGAHAVRKPVTDGPAAGALEPEADALERG